MKARDWLEIQGNIHNKHELDQRQEAEGKEAKQVT